MLSIFMLVLLVFPMEGVSADSGASGDRRAGSPKRTAPLVELRDSSSRVDLGNIALIHEERNPAEAPSSLEFSPDLRLFRPIRGLPDLNRGYTETAIWLCFSVRSAASARSWLLALGPNNIGSVAVYVVDPDGRTETQTAGATEPVGDRRHALSDFVFRLTVGPGEVKTVYLRFASEQALRLRASLWDAHSYIRRDAANTAIVGVILGVVLAIFLYTLFIVISLRERSYAFYLVYLLGFFFYMLSANGAGVAFLWPANEWLGKRMTPFFLCTMLVGVCLFARAYMDTRRNAPGMDFLLLAQAVSAPFLVLGLTVIDFRSAMKFGSLVVASGLTSVLVAGIWSARKGQRQAYYFIGSWIFVFLGGMLAELRSMGLVSGGSELLWSRSEQIGGLAQVLFLSFGISDTVNSMRLEKEKGQRRSIELLERANKVKEEFLIGTSLEFRSPLYGIAGLADRLGDFMAERSGPEERRLVALIHAESTRLLNSVANIATYARLRHGDVALVPERISLKEAVDGAAGVASHLASGRDIGIEISVPDVEIVTDVKAFQQIVYNLFADALKRSHSGTVSIRGHVSEGQLHLFFSDSAPPPSAEVLSRFLFSGGIEDPETLGPGLELFVTRLLAEGLGGSLAYSGREDGGRFDLRLPVDQAWPLERRGSRRRSSAFALAERFGFGARSQRHAAVDLAETPDDGKRRGMVLVFDEDPVFLEALKHYLEDRGYAVHPEQSSARVAVIAAEDPRIDLVLLDASSPKRDGLAACTRIRERKSLGELPIIVMTDRDSSESVAEAFRAGASDYRPKLAPTELLFARVDTHVALKRAVREAIETRRRVAEFEKLKTLGVLSAGVAHEINTPNNAVLRNLPIISEVWKEISPIVHRLMVDTGGFSVRGWSAQELLTELPELLSDTYSAGKQIKKIVEDLKDYARDSSNMPLDAVDLSAVAAYAARLLGPLVERSTRRFVLDAPAGLPQTKADFQKLTQVAVNVLENALQSLPGPEHGVRMSALSNPATGRVLLECRDEGIGIESSIRSRIFEPFFTTKRDRGGTGLGLSVSLGIVREYGGDIEIDSVAGVGTIVRIVLPIAEQEQIA
jgi:signal transduction histidine kinase